MRLISGILFILFFSFKAFAQKITIEGYVREKGSGEYLPFAHILLKGTSIGATSDTSGYFQINTAEEQIKEDTLIVSFVGYNSTHIAITRKSFQKFEIYIEPQFNLLNDVNIKPGENPAWRILRLAINNKSQNNPDERQQYTSSEYSRIRFDLNHFTEKTKHNILLRPFGYIWKNADTEDGIPFLPILLVEKTIQHYYRNSPRDRKDIVTGEQTTGLAGPKIMKFVEDLYQTPNFYEDYIVILDKNFPGPLNDNYKNNYRFYLLDSNVVAGRTMYHISFRPKQKRELAFTGDMLIDSVSGALKDVNVRFDILANVNFVRSFFIHEDYALVNDSVWMLQTSNVLGDFTVIENSADMTGFFGRKAASFSNYILDTSLPSSVFKGVERIVEDDSAKYRPENFWNDNRKIEMNESDKGVFEMTQRLEHDPAFIFRKDLLVGVATGYFPFHKAEIGDVYSFYSYNSIEQSRVKFGFRLHEQNAFPWSGNAYGAYGFHDRQWKYQLTAGYTFAKKPPWARTVGGSYRYDISQLSRSYNGLAFDNIFSSFVQIGSTNASRNYVTDANLYYEQMMGTGVVTRINFFRKKFEPVAGVSFKSLDDAGNEKTNADYTSAGVELTFHFSWQNKQPRASFYDKHNLGNQFRRYPDFMLQFILSGKDILGSEFNYQKLSISARQLLRTRKLGYLKYYVEAGKTWGIVSYPFLNMPFANQLVVGDEVSFNLMNFLEYVADAYISVQLEQHIEGLILDRVPLINKLKWRNFLFAKAYYGYLSAANDQSVYLFPKGTSKMKDPYCELGFGIENIFKFGRMDFVWRVTDINKPDVYYFIVKPSIKFSF